MTSYVILLKEILELALTFSLPNVQSLLEELNYTTL